jgi:DNA-binding IclR family transcriptional regulator
MASGEGQGNGSSDVTGRGVQSAEVGGRILVAMVQAGRPLMLRDLASLADIAPAQAHAYLVSFRKLELVEQDPGTGRYQLGPFALQLGLSRMRISNALRMVGDAAAALAADLGLMITISVWGTFGPTIVQVQEAADQVHVNVRAGAVYSITGTATGRVFGAFMPAKQLEPRLEAELAEGGRTQRVGNPVSRRQFEREVAHTREQGYAVAAGSPVPGITGIAAPVFDHGGQVQLVVTLIGPAPIVGTDQDSPQIAALLDFTRRFSARLGYGANQSGPDEQVEEAAKPKATARRKPQGQSGLHVDAPPV